MKHPRFLAAVCILCGALAACGQSPTLDTVPDRPRLDGGFTYGSGHLVDGGNIPTPIRTTTVAAEGTGTVEDCSDEEHGEGTYGSGHVAAAGTCIW